MKLSQLFTEFVQSEKASGVILIGCTILSLILSNSPFQTEYLSLWHYELGRHTVAHWINDGLMTVFFLLIGLELERQIYIGELSDIRNSLLPIFAAVGGMIFPALFHLMLNYGTDSQSGAGIPMATDIAFALAVLSILGDRVPPALKVFLTALAVIDDLGAIIVIALFYTGSVDWLSLGIAMGVFAALVVLNRLKIMSLIPYLLGGVVMWYFMLSSGIHATITGVLLAFAIPFGNGDEKSPSYIMQDLLHKPVAFFVLPLFALANTSIPIGAHWYQTLHHTNSYGILAGLVVGKPVGITLFSYLSVWLKATRLNTSLELRQVIGLGFLGGIGFTMSIFINLLAFEDPKFIEQSKIAVMISSLIAGTIGFIILKFSLKSAPANS